MTEVKPATEAAAPETQVETPAAPEVKVETIGEVLEQKPVVPPTEPKTVPEAAFLKEKTARKALEKQVAQLQRQVESGASPEEIAVDLDAMAEEYGLDDTNKAFFKKLSGSLVKQIEERAKATIDAKLGPLEERDRKEKIDKIFGTHFEKAMAEMPEFTEVVNRDVIKSLSLDPSNQNKTFAQLIEETYGKAIPGRRTIETTTPRGGVANEAVDVARAAKDPKYYAEVMADPALKAEYNKGLIGRISANL